jgi:holliday junction resolvase YEN1
LFVFDGSKRPCKNGRIPFGGDRDNIAVLKLLLDALEVPYHQAPGEAEAECARLQIVGVVDAVRSEDSDTLMFSCGPMIQRYLVEGGNGKKRSKSTPHVDVHTANNIQEQHGLSREGFILFAILC